MSAMTTKEFIRRALLIPGNAEKYDYRLVEYVNCETPVIIICKIHGQFLQRPYKHLCGHGCPKCAGSGTVISLEECTRRIKKQFGDLYDLSLVNYINSRTPVEIICDIHGTFQKILKIFGEVEDVHNVENLKVDRA